MQLLWPGFLCLNEIATVHNICLNKKCWQENWEVAEKTQIEASPNLSVSEAKRVLSKQLTSQDSSGLAL